MLVPFLMVSLSRDIGISFLDNKLVTISVIVAAAVANIPEGLASGVGLKEAVIHLGIYF